jgi:hypothetical protein
MPLASKGKKLRYTDHPNKTAAQASAIVPLPIQFVEFGGNSLVVISPKKDDDRRKADRACLVQFYQHRGASADARPVSSFY